MNAVSHTPELDLEYRIDQQALLLATVKTQEERAAAWGELQRLHKLRSPERVAEMEREQGLCR